MSVCVWNPLARRDKRQAHRNGQNEVLTIISFLGYCLERFVGRSERPMWRSRRFSEKVRQASDCGGPSFAARFGFAPVPLPLPIPVRINVNHEPIIGPPIPHPFLHGGFSGHALGGIGGLGGIGHHGFGRRRR